METQIKRMTKNHSQDDRGNRAVKQAHPDTSNLCECGYSKEVHSPYGACPVKVFQSKNHSPQEPQNSSSETEDSFKSSQTQNVLCDICCLNAMKYGKGYSLVGHKVICLKCKNKTEDTSNLCENCRFHKDWHRDNGSRAKLYFQYDNQPCKKFKPKKEKKQ